MVFPNNNWTTKYKYIHSSTSVQSIFYALYCSVFCITSQPHHYLVQRNRSPGCRLYLFFPRLGPLPFLLIPQSVSILTSPSPSPSPSPECLALILAFNRRPLPSCCSLLLLFSLCHCVHHYA
ncbi:uncharacterized protein EURHEDRAFT_33087 [Aspergillus ruber CBS 135680]|uniref:Uncharacterized protein n=1 Tax=Aspergillus ruber (strain CBS 135680) TaxID=1388766 RepID=A0A017SSE2_ASPRC|nr:uncharacterized protein EURHEDRAFT_33087 [Aspergillus ruber CBS 135680]EYE99893.1 hypothetical protein EURHEDRAFT_33087 [Aspergillus ruber CBS 135680]